MCYDRIIDMNNSVNNVFQIYKNIGETPLMALERFRDLHKEFADLPMTYAGRLDPMAEGILLILVGDECKNKDKYLGLDKEYEVEIVFGIETDSYDALGIARITRSDLRGPTSLSSIRSFQNYIGKFKQKYPPYSSKTIQGVQLHKLARNAELPEKMPEKDVEIYSIELIGSRKIDSNELKKTIFEKIDLVKGDFRQKEIKTRWNQVFDNIENLNPKQSFEVIKILVKCSSGTYMRSLANRIGEDCGIGAFALGIKRLRIV